MRTTTFETAQDIAAMKYFDICVKDLSEYFAQSVFTVSDPVVFYHKIVSNLANRICFAESLNKHDRMYATPELIDEILCNAIETSPVGPKEDLDDRAQLYRNMVRLG